MPTFKKLLEESSLMIIRAASAEVATRLVQDELEDDIEIWAWSAESGLGPIRADARGSDLTPGSSPNNPTEAIKQFLAAPPDKFLILLGAESLPEDTGIKVALKKAADSREEGEASPTRWVALVLAGGPGKGLPGRLLERVKIDPEILTLSVADTTATAASPMEGRPATALDVTDIKEVAKFDSPEWTRYLNNLPLKVLAEICAKELYKHSVNRLEALRDDLDSIFVGKRDLINVMCWCSVAHLPMLLLGTWGTAKSMLVRQFAAGLGITSKNREVATEDEFVRDLKKLKDGDASVADRLHRKHEGRHFEYLVTRFTTPEELIGTIDVDLLLSHGVFLRKTRSLMPRAEIVFLDEVFKANSSILNVLLSLINERLFYNAGVPWTVNMVMLFGASNEPPQEEELGAFFDRFPIRTLSDPVANDQLEDLLQRSHALQCASLISPGDDVSILDPTREIAALRVTQQACVNDLRLLRRVALFKYGGTDIHGPDNKSARFVEQFRSLVLHLRDPYDISDRTAGHLFRLARCKNLLEGNEEKGLNDSDLKVLYYCGKDAQTLRQLRGIVDEMIG